ncbi:hypothetical protein SAMN00017405_0806 [Desulfonispora thiosulfatigenes DSM 11270]|uniref:Uncharacterized protein n=1 Tax=Desulfonispora thiosulfatigenes DSM 11270 TaxID=656914 RepID=A0A1W1UFH1_DESTI|nr:hypothetical protein [Desulfonispora thiosulfatigenes]SMB79848.1 hypothetical protein SAMN00017405_0806 [Desulfonispora thiosulfatigenes DSM 11270]
MLSYWKPSFWMVVVLIIAVIIVIALVTNPKQWDMLQAGSIVLESHSGILETAYHAEYNKVKI